MPGKLDAAPAGSISGFSLIVWKHPEELLLPELSWQIEEQLRSEIKCMAELTILTHMNKISRLYDTARYMPMLTQISILIN